MGACLYLSIHMSPSQGLEKIRGIPCNPRKSAIQTKENSETHRAMTGIWGVGVLISIYTHCALTGLGKNPRHLRHPRKSAIQTKGK